MTYLSLAFHLDYEHTDTCDKESMIPRWQDVIDRHSTPVKLCFDIFLYWWEWSLGGWHTLFCTTSNRWLRHHKATCNNAALHYLDPLTLIIVRQMGTCWYCIVFRSKYVFYQWTRQRIHDKLNVVDRYMTRATWGIKGLGGTLSVVESEWRIEDPHKWSISQWSWLLVIDNES